MNVKVEFARPEYLSLDTGDTWRGFPVSFSIPGSPHALVMFPADWTRDRIITYMNQAQQEGEIVDWRFEHLDYSPLGWPDYKTLAEPNWAIGDTFIHHNMIESIRAIGKDGEGIRVGVCDTGVDIRHAAFAGVDAIGDGLTDVQGHGSHVASTILGPWGIAKKAKLGAYLALPFPGGGGTEQTVAQSVRAAVDAGCKVINLSLGGRASQVMDSICEYAKSKGAVVCVAAGNSGGAIIGSPARAADLIVMAHDRSKAWAGFTDGRNWSNPNRVGFNGVQVRAAAYNTPSGSVEFSGTSMACPHCAAACALLMAAGMDRPKAIAYVLSHRSNPPDGPGMMVFANDFGQPTPPPPPPPPPSTSEIVEVGYRRRDQTVRWYPV